MRAAIGGGLLALALVAGGCGKDPCDGISGSCISARVEGAVHGLDQLRVVLDGASGAQVSPATPAPLSLPVRLAIVLPAAVTSPATLTIEGLAGGQAVATSGAQSVSFTPGARAHHTFTLAAGAPADMAVGDAPFTNDMGVVIVPGHVTVAPTMLQFADTPRGATSAPQTLTLYNRTGQTITTLPTDMGDGGDFMPISISGAGCVANDQGVTLPADVDCQLQMVFHPTVSGDRSVTMSLTLSNGDTAQVTFKGVGTRAWSAETAAPPNQAAQTNLTGVWAGDGVAHVVGSFDNGGSFPAPMALTSMMPGVWTVDTTASVGSPFSSVGGADPTHVAAGADSSIFMWSGGSWSTFPIVPNDGGTIGAIMGLWAASVTEAHAVTNTGQTYDLSATGEWKLGVVAPTPLFAVSGAGAGEWVVVGNNGYIGHMDASAGMYKVLTPITTAVLRGVWEAAGATDVVAVGDAPAMSQPGTIVHCKGVPLACATETSPVNGSLNAVAGRKDATTGKLDIWAVGALGNHVLHSTGDGTWTAVQVPNNEAMNAVYALPSGEVYAVGYQGQVNHLY